MEIVVKLLQIVSFLLVAMMAVSFWLDTDREDRRDWVFWALLAGMGTVMAANVSALVMLW